MSKNPGSTKLNDALKILQQQEDLDKRESIIREEESTLQYIRKFKDDLAFAAAQLSKREDKLTNTEARMMLLKNEEGGLKRTELELELSSVKATVNEILLSSYVNVIDDSIQQAISDLNKRVQTVEDLENKLIEERRLLNEEHTRLVLRQQEADQYLTEERESLRRGREQLNQDKAMLASALAEEKSREEERDMYNKLIHDLEMNDERVRRHLKAIEDELDMRRLKMDVETDELRKSFDELSKQISTHKSAEAQFAQDRAQLKAEKQNMSVLLARLNDREQSLTEKTEELEKERASVRFDRSKLFREQQELNQLIAHNETLKREVEIDGMRNQAIAAKTLELKAEVDTANTQLEDRQAYLDAWETELNNREEEYSRLVEQTISIPKLHQSNNEYQNVSSGIIKMQSRRLKEHYLVGQQRRVFSASVKRGATSSAGNASIYRTVLSGSDIVSKPKAKSSNIQSTKHDPDQAQIEKRPEVEYDDIRIDDDDNYDSNEEFSAEANETKMENNQENEKSTQSNADEQSHTPSTRSHSSNSRSATSSRSSSPASQSGVNNNTSSSPKSLKQAVDKDPTIEAKPVFAEKAKTSNFSNISTLTNKRTLLPPMSAASVSTQQQQQRPISSSQTTSVPAYFSSTQATTQRWTTDHKHSAAATEANLATSSRICSLAHTVSELQRNFHRYAARANLLVSDRDPKTTDRFFQRVTPSQRADIETAIWYERTAAQDIGLRRHFSLCPVVVEKDFTSNPVEMLQKVTKWWVGVEESLQHSDERSLQSRMDLLEKAVEALSQALERSEDITQTGAKNKVTLNQGKQEHNGSALIESGTSLWAGGGATATLSARRAQKHQRPATAGGTTAPTSIPKDRLNLFAL